MNASDSPAQTVLEVGLEAWKRGDLDALERLLDPNVTLTAEQPGPWDCQNRDQVISLLRTRELNRQRDEPPEVRLTAVDDNTFRVSGIGSPDVATMVTITGGLVTSMQQVTIGPVDADGDAAVTAIRTGDVHTLEQLLTARPDLTRIRVPGHRGRTLLHIATDWPGYLPDAHRSVQLLIERGADPNVRGDDHGGGETPLHWAASNDDVDVARSLLDGGADPEAPNGSIGTPLDNAIGYGCLYVARLLVERGAKVDKLWHAAALGRLDRLEQLLEQAAGTPNAAEEINQGFWHACAAAQRRAAERLLRAGARLDWVPDYGDGTALQAATSQGTRRELLVAWLTDLEQPPP